MRIATLRAAAAGATLFLAPAAFAQTAQTLPFTQNWTNTGLISVNDDWSSVPGIIGYLGQTLTAATAVDPQTVVGPSTVTDPSDIDIIANQMNPNTLATGGVAEFELTNPAIALNGSGTADAPHIVIRVNTTGLLNIRVQYNLRDLDGSADNAIQPVALQYRVGTTGDFTNVPAGFVADATSGPDLATLVTPVDVILPEAAASQASLDIRIITANAAGNDEWVGIDDISITGSPLTTAEGGTQGNLTLAVANPIRSAATVRFSTETAGEATLALYDMLGRRVAVLAEGTTAGERTVALDTAGLAPGAYLLRLSAGRDVLTQSVSVVR